MTARRPRLAAELIGCRAPCTLGRTDDGTPIALSDFAGRTLAVFAIRAVDEERAAMLADLSSRVDSFLALECSPIVVTTEPDRVVERLREETDHPFVVISDRAGAIHADLCAFPDGDAAAWIIDDAGTMVAAVPALPPREMVQATLSSLVRVIGRGERP